MNKIEFGFFLERVPIFFVGVIGWVLLRFAVHDPRKLNVAALEV